MITIYYARWDGRNGSRELLLQAAAEWYGRYRLPEKEGAECFLPGERPVVSGQKQFVLEETESRGKPRFLKPRGIEFSISHTGDLWMCAFSKFPVGLDVQEERKLDREKISRRFFHPKEDAWLKKQDYRDFFAVWAAKESYLKYTGEGLSGGMERFCVVTEDGFLSEINGIFQHHDTFFLEPYPQFCVSTGGRPEEQRREFIRLQKTVDKKM